MRTKGPPGWPVTGSPAGLRTKVSSYEVGRGEKQWASRPCPGADGPSEPSFRFGGHFRCCGRATLSSHPKETVRPPLLG